MQMTRATSKQLGRHLRKRIPLFALAIVVLWSANDYLRSRAIRAGEAVVEQIEVTETRLDLTDLAELGGGPL
jgi:hypothetical protein